ncbi:MAG: ComEC/Rec2 family competence protein [Legionellaceae bacterium]|nr:ComEC/Rec2 family competence protein [Legionellaceae bacterium]
MEIFCFVAGVVFYYSHSFWALLPLCSVGIIGFRFYLWIAWGFGCLLAGWHSASELPQNMPTGSKIPISNITGIVSSIPKMNGHRIRFEFEIQQLKNHPAKAHIWLGCYHRCPNLHGGERWQLQTSIKYLPAPNQYRHPQWVGYIHPEQSKYIAPASGLYRMLALRDYLARRYLQAFPPENNSVGILQGLTLGIGNAIPSEQWDLFRETGTTHLVVISGEHIAFMAGIIYKIIDKSWRRWPRACMLLPAQRIATLSAIILSGLYAWLAGWGAPVQRAWLAFVGMALRYFWSQYITHWQVWRYSLGLVVCWEPHVVFTPGFYFSFMAVALLILAHHRYRFRGIRYFLWMQCLCTIVLMPISAYFFGYGAWIGLLSNLWGIPWVSFVVLPLSLISLGLIACNLHCWILSLTAWSIHLFLEGLHYMAMTAQWNSNFEKISLPAMLGMLFALWLYLLFPLRAIKPIILFLLLICIIYML